MGSRLHLWEELQSRWGGCGYRKPLIGAISAVSLEPLLTPQDPTPMFLSPGGPLGSHPPHLTLSLSQPALCLLPLSPWTWSTLESQLASLISFPRSCLPTPPTWPEKMLGTLAHQVLPQADAGTCLLPLTKLPFSSRLTPLLSPPSHRPDAPDNTN